MGTGLPERARSAGASQGLGCTEASLSGWDCVWVWTAEPLASSLPGAEPVSPGAEPGTLGYRDTGHIRSPGTGAFQGDRNCAECAGCSVKGCTPCPGSRLPHAGPEPLFFQQLHLERAYP